MGRQLARQAVWLRESLLWNIDRRILSEWDSEAKPTALDVGCGHGDVTEIISELLDVKGVDVDEASVEFCRKRGLIVEVAAAEKLPFDDSSFDVVCCSFLMLWLKNPLMALREMKRVSRRWVACLAEPDIGGRLDHPQELWGLRELVANGIRSEGGDPYVGRKLREMFISCGMDADIGVHGGVWPLEKLREESEAEWKYIELTAETDSKEGFRALKRAWEESLSRGSMFQYNPVFYAFAKK